MATGSAVETGFGHDRRFPIFGLLPRPETLRRLDRQGHRRYHDRRYDAARVLRPSRGERPSPKRSEEHFPFGDDVRRTDEQGTGLVPRSSEPAVEIPSLLRSRGRRRRRRRHRFRRHRGSEEDPCGLLVGSAAALFPSRLQLRHDAEGHGGSSKERNQGRQRHSSEAIEAEEGRKEGSQGSLAIVGRNGSALETGDERRPEYRSPFRNAARCLWTTTIGETTRSGKPCRRS